MARSLADPSYPPNPQVVPAGGQQVRVDSLGVRDPHDLGGRVRVVKGVPAYELRTLFFQANQLDLQHETPAATHYF